MKTIKIEIDDNLTEEQEVLAIAKKLAKLSIGKNQKLIGNSTQTKDLKTIIEINRTSKEKVFEPVICGCCETQYYGKGEKLFTNIGGKTRKKMYCSIDCRDSVLELLGDRGGKTKGKLMHFIAFGRDTRSRD